VITKKFIIIFFFILIPYAAASQEDYKVHMDNGQRFIEAKDYRSGIEEFTKARELVSRDIDKARIENSIGWSYFLVGDVPQASAHLEISLSLGEKVGNSEIAQLASNNLGLVKFQNGNLDKAKEYFENRWAKGSEIATRYSKLIEEQKVSEEINQYVRAGIYYRANKNFDKAIAEYDKALQLAPNDPRILEFKGYSLYRIHQYDEALAVLGKSFKIDPSRLNTVVNLLKLYCSTNDTIGISELLNRSSVLLKQNIQSVNNDTEFQRICGENVISRLQQ
jgi:tetratricopeptide (TPR) repeat protein